MTRKFKSILAGLLCLACLPMPLGASAKCTVTETDNNYEDWDGPYVCHEVTIESDLFIYHITGRYSDQDGDGATVSYFGGILDTDAVDFQLVVIGIVYEDGEDTPLFYIVNNPKRYSFGNLGITFYYSELAPYLDGELPQIGDLLYIENYLVSEGVPAELSAGGATPDEDAQPYVRNLGSGVDLLGEDFKKVLYYEMFYEPTVFDAETRMPLPVSQSHYIYDRGNLNNDDSVTLADVVILNKHLMSGYPISYYAKGCADVDNNGIVDEVDSLNILKSIIGLVDLDELG